MSILPALSFSKTAQPKKGVAVILVPQGVSPTAAAGDIDPGKVLDRAASASKFAGKSKTAIDIYAPHDTHLDRMIALGIGNVDELKETDWMAIGGQIRARVAKNEIVTIMTGKPGAELSTNSVAALAHGYLLRAYDFDKYKTKKKDGDDSDAAKAQKVTIVHADVAGAKKAWAEHEAVARGTMLARDLVNEPANILGPLEFAARAEALAALGVGIKTLTEKEMKKLGMGALLGVAQGSVRPPRMVIMTWNGGKAKEAPLAFIGKGVVFDTGGISIKPAAGMEDMKGDMGGAAAVTGLMHTLAARKAKVNAIGIIGLVENMPDGNAQRPGDVVTSMSGQTIEVINTDAEGRLVLCDALWYCKEQFKPKFMVNLATLTGAVMVALGQHHAGLFSNNDELAGNLFDAGMASGEKLWRLPLGPDYDKMIDSKIADMKNVGSRYGGSITAAQFLQRYVGDVPWAHLDIAGTAMASMTNDYSTSWASGFGVRLLNQMVADVYEK